jgi:hypothetical protein
VQQMRYVVHVTTHSNAPVDVVIISYLPLNAIQ